MAEATHLLGLPLKHKHKNLEGIEPSDHHDEYNWAHQCHHRCFFLPFVYTNDFRKLGAVFEHGAAGKFDETKVNHPSVVKVGIYYYLFYAGDDGTEAGSAIGVARATNPEGPYTRLNNGDPILEVADPDGFFCPSVIYDDYETDPNKKWKMWIFKTRSGEAVREIMYSYSANPDSGWSTPVAVFVTADDPWWGHSVLRMGRLWLFFVPRRTAPRNLHLYASSSPSSKGDDMGVCIPLGSAGEWDELQIRYVGAVYISGVLYVLYSGMNGAYLKIGMAFCAGDLTNVGNYDKYDLNPVIPRGETGDPDATHSFSPCLLQVKEKFYVWYTGHNPTDRKICLATIP